MSEAKETVERIGDYAWVNAGEGYNRPGELLCSVTNTGNGYIAYFPTHTCMHQDYYVCLDYAQAYDLVLALSMFKKELGFAEPVAEEWVEVQRVKVIDDKLWAKVK